MSIKLWPEPPAPSGGDGGGLTDSFTLGIRTGDTNVAPGDAAAFALALSLSDSVPAQSEAVQLRFPSGAFGDTSPAPTDARQLQIRSWATGCADNDSSQTTPANANGQANGTLANVKTNNAIGDLTNPVILTTGSMNWPGGVVGSTPLADLYFSVGSRATATDTVTISYNDGAGHSGTLWTWGTAAENHLTTPLTVALHPDTVLGSVVFTVSYQATVVAVPQGTLALDAVGLRAATVL